MCPCCVVFLGDFDALMSEQYGDAVEWNPRLQQFDCECVAEAMCVAVFDSCHLKQFAEPALPATYYCLKVIDSIPEILSDAGHGI